MARIADHVDDGDGDGDKVTRKPAYRQDYGTPSRRLMMLSQIYGSNRRAPAQAGTLRT